MVDYALAINGKADFINFRLYGGWMENGLHTNTASKIQQAVSFFDFFLLFNRREKIFIRGDIELVTRLYLMPDLQWDDTVTTRSGISRLRLVNHGLPTGCIGTNDTCPVRILFRFARKRAKKCPISGCNVTNKDAFRIVEQKMVDTMISCDIIALAEDNRVEGIIVTSDDFDLLPPLAVAAQKYKNEQKQSKQISLLRTNDNYDYEIFEKLSDAGLKVQVRRN
ncbi:MAG: NYN domain-containing protein [Desulfobacteraceae bacterium]|nr:NYN domain-containing protein [Desulfobacteraceae bacterium]